MVRAVETGSVLTLRLGNDTYRYAVVGSEQEQPASEFVTQIAQGDQRYDSRANASYWHMGSWTGGLGIKYGNFREHQGRYWFGSGIDTRFPNQLTLGPLVRELATFTMAKNADGGHFSGFTTYKNDEFFGLGGDIVRWNGSTLTSVYSNASVNINVMTSYTRPDGTVRLYGFDTFSFVHSTDGTTWALTGATPVGAHALQYDSHLILIGGTDTQAQIDTSDVGDGNLSSYTTMFVLDSGSWPYTANPKIGILFRNADGDIVPYVLVADYVNESLSTLYVMNYYGRSLLPVLIGKLRYTVSKQRLHVWNDSLYIADGPSLLKFNIDQYQEVGPVAAQGMPVAYSFFHGMTSTRAFLYLQSGNSFLLGASHMISAHNGLGVHPLVTQSTPIRGLHASTRRPGRIYFLECATGSPSVAIKYIEESLYGTNPANDGNYQYATTGYLVTPWYDLGFLDLDKILLDLAIDAQDLSASQQVTVSYQVNGIGPDDFSTDATTLTTFTANGGKVAFGSGDGVVCRSLRLKIQLDRGGTTTASPKVRGLALRYLVTPNYRATKSLVLSIEETGDLRGAYATTAEALIAELRALYDADTLVKYAVDDEAETSVKLVTFQPTTYTTGDGQRGGGIRLQVLEPV